MVFVCCSQPTRQSVSGCGTELPSPDRRTEDSERSPRDCRVEEVEMRVSFPTRKLRDEPTENVYVLIVVLNV